MSPNRSVITEWVGLVVLPIGAIALAIRYLPIPGQWTLYVVMAGPALALAAPIATLVLLWGRHWVLASLAGVVLIQELTLEAANRLATGAC